MIFKNKNIYLPGYQKMDNTFSFSHGDYEDMQLPVGETVQILATSKLNGETYYSLKDITIEEVSNVTLNMTMVTEDELESILLSSL